MSTIVSTNNGSEDSLNPSWRWGFRSNLRQIRPIVDGARPDRRAIDARDQWVASLGVSSSVAVRTCSTWSSRVDGGRPGRITRAVTTTPLNDLLAQDLRYRLAAHLDLGDDLPQFPVHTSTAKTTTQPRPHREAAASLAATTRTPPR